MKILVISTYELGRQPFGVVSPASWLRRAGHEVVCLDLTRESLDEGAVRAAQLIGIYLPMHTATRLAAKLIPKLREMNAGAYLCCYGLYAPMNAGYLRGLGVGTILGGEFEGELVKLAARLHELKPLFSRDEMSDLGVRSTKENGINGLHLKVESDGSQSRFDNERANVLSARAGGQDEKEISLER